MARKAGTSGDINEIKEVVLSARARTDRALTHLANISNYVELTATYQFDDLDGNSAYLVDSQRIQLMLSEVRSHVRYVNDALECAAAATH